MTQHLPDGGEHLIRSYVFYSNKSRGLRGQAQASPGAATLPTSSAQEARQRWACLRADTHRQAALIKQVYEIDPLSCPKCGAEMKIISFIERNQSAVIEKLLRHCGLWEETSARAPPPVRETVMV